MRNMFKETIYEIVSDEAQFIWGCENAKEAEEQLKYVKNELGYKDAFINIYEQSYIY